MMLGIVSLTADSYSLVVNGEFPVDFIVAFARNE